MLVQIVGIQPMDFTFDKADGSKFTFKGDKVHCVDLETTGDRQMGHRVMDFKIPADSHLANIPLEIGGKYRLFFNKYGKPDFLAKELPNK